MANTEKAGISTHRIKQKKIIKKRSEPCANMGERYLHARMKCMFAMVGERNMTLVYQAQDTAILPYLGKHGLATTSSSICIHRQNGGKI